MFLKVYAAALFAVWVVWYLGKCYVEWEVLNPLAYLIELPDVDAATRSLWAAVLFCTLAFTAIAVACVRDIIATQRDTEHVPDGVYVTGCKPHPETVRLAQEKTGPGAFEIGVGVASGVVVGNLISDIWD